MEVSTRLRYLYRVNKTNTKKLNDMVLRPHTDPRNKVIPKKPLDKMPRLKKFLEENEAEIYQFAIGYPILITKTVCGAPKKTTAVFFDGEGYFFDCEEW